ncbi:centrosomal protein of 55 kDa-like [Salminus brasiliensis]|uniref:centrosomal protein of 55 kDa-like n=1 Tax=Salminus brasiliensis TaxID=930266 RepID=UPI003B838EFC
MASKFPKPKAVTRADGKGSSPQSESELSKLRKENAYLKKTLEELACQKGEPSDSENNKLLLERILALETLREKNSQQILSRDQEIASLRQQLRSDSDEAVVGLEAQLNQQRLEAEMRERLFQRLKLETEDVKNKLAAVSAKCQDLENRECPAKSGTTDGPSTTRDAAVIQEHLKDALEKNQQWLAYDQQREAYVKAVLERTCHLEQQLNQANEALQLKHEEASCEVKQAVEKQQQHYEELLDLVRDQLEEEQKRVAQGKRQLSRLQQQCEDRQQDLVETRQQLQAEHLRGKKKLQEERRRSGECMERLHAELDGVSARLEEERLRSAELQQQIQMSAKDLEDEKRDNHHLQRQLYRVLKELRKAKDQVARLESEVRSGLAQKGVHHTDEDMSELGTDESCVCGPQKAQRESPSSERSDCNKREREESQQSFTSPTRAHSLLDESFLECPNCRAQYPTSRHRELLVHIDQCFE